MEKTLKEKIISIPYTSGKKKDRGNFNIFVSDDVKEAILKFKSKILIAKDSDSVWSKKEAFEYLEVRFKEIFGGFK